MKVITISPDKLYHDISEVTNELISVAESEASEVPFSSEGTGEWLARQSTNIFGTRESLLGHPAKWAKITTQIAGNTKAILIPLYELSDIASHQTEKTEPDTQDKVP